MVSDKMKRVVNKAKNVKEAEEWDIQQCIQMTPDQRQAAALELKKRAFGNKVPDVREYHRK